MREKVIVISGGTKGVGSEVAIKCASRGAKVVIGGRDREAASTIIERVESLDGECIFVETNLREIDSCKQLFKESMSQYQRVDGFVNYAGITTVTPLLDCTEQDFDEIMDINIKAAFFNCQQAVNCMKNRGGSIVLIGSTHAWKGDLNRAAYACSKGAILTLSKHISSHYAKNMIRCNVVTMGWTPTEGELSLRKEQGLSENELRNMASQAIPMGRMQDTDDYLDGILYLLSDSSMMTTGSNLKINGGLQI